MPPFYSQVQQPTPSKFITGIVILYFKLTLCHDFHYVFLLLVEIWE